MTVVRDTHEAHGATFHRVEGREFPAEYGRPERTHRAVRNAAGVTEHAFDVVTVAGGDRHAVVEGAVTNTVPDADGEGVYAFVLDDDGAVAADCYVFTTGDQFLCFLPLGAGESVAADWQTRADGRNAAVSLATDDFGTFGVHGPEATEKIASVLHGGSPPEDRLRFVRGEMEAGVTVVRDDDLAGEEGYLVVCAADDASPVFETLLVRGLNAVPFGRETWKSLTLEAGTPLFDSELAGRDPGALGVQNAIDEGAFGVATDGLPEADERLVGLEPDGVPEAGATVTADGEPVGEVTRAATSPMRDAPLAFAVVSDWTSDLAVETGDGVVDADVANLPFVDTGERSKRVPEF
jgi:aminomethyltransferase